MKALQHRVFRLEAVRSRHRFRHLSDAEFDAMMAADFRAWLETQPDDYPEEVRAEASALVEALEAGVKPQ